MAITAKTTASDIVEFKSRYIVNIMAKTLEPYIAMNAATAKRVDCAASLAFGLSSSISVYRL